MHENDHQNPCVGIFWLYGDELLTDSTPIDRAEPYGDCLTHPAGHADYWTTLQSQGIVDGTVEWADVPRGRVVFQRKTGKYVIYIDKCILSPAIVNRISTILRLPRDRTMVMTDGHYRCPACLNRRTRTKRHLPTGGDPPL